LPEKHIMKWHGFLNIDSARSAYFAVKKAFQHRLQLVVFK